jgi:predicted transcriptional regulator
MKKKYNIVTGDAERVAKVAGVSADMVRKVVNNERDSQKVEKILDNVSKVRTLADKTVKKIIQKFEEAEASIDAL